MEIILMVVVEAHNVGDKRKTSSKIAMLETTKGD
jgi:hypothetical protein